jgi:hypothetical protein
MQTIIDNPNSSQSIRDFAHMRLQEDEPLPLLPDSDDTSSACITEVDATNVLPSVSVDDIKIGCTVLIKGLISKPELNGKLGTVKSQQGDGRWGVEARGQHGVMLALKGSCLTNVKDLSALRTTDALARYLILSGMVMFEDAVGSHACVRLKPKHALFESTPRRAPFLLPPATLGLVSTHKGTLGCSPNIHWTHDFNCTRLGVVILYIGGVSRILASISACFKQAYM